MPERRGRGSTHGGNTDQVIAAGRQMLTSQQPQHLQRTSFVTLPAVESSTLDAYPTGQPALANHGRFSDPMQQLPTNHNLSITDTDKLQQRGHENLAGGYHGDGYRGDRMPSRYLFHDTVDPAVQNVGHSSGRYPVERQTNFQPYYHGDASSSSSAAAAASYSRRLPWSDSTCSQVCVYLYMDSCCISEVDCLGVCRQ